MRVETLNANVKVFKQNCSAFGPVERCFCGSCRSVVATIAESGEVYLAAGCIEDASIPADLARAWQTAFTESAIDEAVSWWPAPAEKRKRGASRVLTGGCACGACRFEAVSGDEFQTQHCYCNLCRRLSGSVAQTWVPVRPEGWKWTKDTTLELVRTTRHGQRHMCTACGCTMTIVYDSQPDCVWPVAGAIDDDCLPKDVSAALCRAIHICCSMMQPWYVLPEDGKEAPSSRPITNGPCSISQIA